jgi:hypothetical protein
MDGVRLLPTKSVYAPVSTCLSLLMKRAVFFGSFGMGSAATAGCPARTPSFDGVPQGLEHRIDVKYSPK